ncbi:C45 family autoproteolytic acyltransferase/hydolase [Halomonas sp. H5]|uniref:C45 family autoproteolytic acyltransferase/hydolase n=1 Tax=Halomonas sp. H5 TaxID=3423910 RepID=UPI003D36ADB7
MLAVTRLSGGRHDLGYAHGAAHATAIQASLAAYARLFHDFAGLDWPQARRDALALLPAIEARFPAILDEVDGIARGAGVEVEDILVLNCRSEIALTHAGDGCSAFGLQRHGQQWLAQNWDWRGDQQANLVALEIRGDKAPALLSLGEAGMVAKIGMNEHGLGVCLNAIRSRTCGDGLPIHFALRQWLEGRDFDNALATLESGGVASPAHFLVASDTGRALGLEVNPGPAGRLTPRDGVVTHTNHLCDPGLRTRLADYPRPDSGPRLGRLDALLSPPPEAPDAEALFEILSDHHGYPYSLCRHPDPDQPEAERMETLFGVVMNLDRRELWLRLGKPCRASSQRLVLAP